jgi:cytoskeletal protein CcmA (bactofilin family)
VAWLILSSYYCWVIDVEEDCDILVSSIRGGEVMEVAMKRIISDENGKVLILTLVLLIVGGLIMTPLLGLMTTGLVAGQVYEKKTAELYAADAGVEYAIWHLQQGGSVDDILELTINGKAVTVEIEELPHDCYELAIYEITSTATSQDGSSTTVLTHVTNITLYMDDLFLDANAGTVYIPNNVYVEGDVELSAAVHIVGDLKAGGNVILNRGSLIGGIVCVGGDLTLNNNATIEAEVYVAGDLTLNNEAIIESDLHVGGTVTISGSGYINGGIHAEGDVTVDGQSPQVSGNVCSNGNVSVAGANALIAGNVSAGGTISPPDPPNEKITGTGCPGGDCGVCEIEYCPLDAGNPEILVWVVI